MLALITAPAKSIPCDSMLALQPQNVRARLAQTDAGSADAIAIGEMQVLTIGFAQEWLGLARSSARGFGG
ncbi:hypothetical protein [Bradyrhizobium sp. NBAIM01]|uniref:hypothetical protein n=1 Tax=Bradyrhizobium sp. NBAIM01 TaxID=2793818 RepID=UPI001CD7D1A8|nr:hypothetical protein [Bradyrhizobium sp. NBAIM01]MCA1510509.1 hypothetical protein [Bradyrhizobium sp. NBAIM01]